MFLPVENMSQARFQPLLWKWPMAVIVLLAGLMTLPPSSGRTIGWYGFVALVIGTAIHAYVRGLQFDERMLW